MIKRNKIIFFCRDGIEAKFVAHILFNKDLLDLVVVESGKKARAQKLKSYFRGGSILFFPQIVLDILSVYCYSLVCEQYLSYRFSKFRHYPNVGLEFIDDINEKKSVDIVKKYKNSLVIVMGTGIIKNEFLDVKTKAILNIHGGIVPKYRNVHSDFWALVNRDYGNMGTSIIYLDKGIDTGDIAVQEAINYRRGDGIFGVKEKNLRLAAKLIVKAARKSLMNELSRKIQNKEVRGSFYRTPRFMDLLNLVRKEL